MNRRNARYRRRRLRPQFVIFCMVCLLIIAGIIYLITSCSARNKRIHEVTEDPAEQTNTATVVPDNYVSASAELGKGSLILVNNNNDYTFPQVEQVGCLENCSGNYLVRDYSVTMAREAFSAFDSMLSDFAAATGLTDVNITSAYRSYEEQQNVFEASAQANGIEHATIYVAHPGGSEHHTGLAADLNVYNVSTGVCYDFDGQGDYGWMYDHCADYGIVLRYTAEKMHTTAIAAESWHFRYVGVPHAAYMNEHSLCLEEYVDLLRQYTVDKPLNYNDYTIYFCAEDELYVPQSGNYAVSGNNVDGFIVTLKR